MHGLLPADITRRILSLAAAVAVPAAVTAVLALATPAQASPAQAQSAAPGRRRRGTGVSVVIDSMSPQTAKPGATVTVTGTVSNGTSQAKAGLDVQL